MLWPWKNRWKYSVGGRNLAITMRTPGHDAELAAGFLFTEGLLKTADQIRSIAEAANQVSLERKTRRPRSTARYADQ